MESEGLTLMLILRSDQHVSLPCFCFFCPARILDVGQTELQPLSILLAIGCDSALWLMLLMSWRSTMSAGHCVPSSRWAKLGLLMPGRLLKGTEEFVLGNPGWGAVMTGKLESGLWESRQWNRLGSF